MKFKSRQCFVCRREDIPEGEATYLAHFRLWACQGRCSDIAASQDKDHSQSKRGRRRTKAEFLAAVGKAVAS